MNKSESIKELSTALSIFQGEIKNPSNTATNPFFKSKYAPLNDVLNLVRPILSKNGLSIVQAPSGDGENIIVTTTLLHQSGEWLEFPPLVLKADKATAQGAGSAITYARRYAISAILGISSEDDDDGNEAEPKKDKPIDKPKEEVKTDTISQAQQKRLFAISNGNNDLVKEALKMKNLTSTSQIKKTDYNAIVKYIEDVVKANNEKDFQECDEPTPF